MYDGNKTPAKPAGMLGPVEAERPGTMMLTVHGHISGPY